MVLDGDSGRMSARAWIVVYPKIGRYSLLIWGQILVIGMTLVDRYLLCIGKTTQLIIATTTIPVSMGQRSKDHCEAECDICTFVYAGSL